MIGSWWMLGVMSSILLSILLLILLIVEKWLHHHESMRGPMGENLLGVDLQNWMTRIFIITVLQCAMISLLSHWPTSRPPIWLGPLLQGITYASATIYYFSGRDNYIEE